MWLEIYKPNEHVFKREDTVDHVYVILEGLVQGY